MWLFVLVLHKLHIIIRIDKILTCTTICPASEVKVCPDGLLSVSVMRVRFVRSQSFPVCFHAAFMCSG